MWYLGVKLSQVDVLRVVALAEEVEHLLIAHTCIQDMDQHEEALVDDYSSMVGVRLTSCLRK
jgi:hypothetical protein